MSSAAHADGDAARWRAASSAGHVRYATVPSSRRTSRHATSSICSPGRASNSSMHACRRDRGARSLDRPALWRCAIRAAPGSRDGILSPRELAPCLYVEAGCSWRRSTRSGCLPGGDDAASCGKSRASRWSTCWRGPGGASFSRRRTPASGLAGERATAWQQPAQGAAPSLGRGPDRRRLALLATQDAALPLRAVTLVEAIPRGRTPSTRPSCGTSLPALRLRPGLASSSPGSRTGRVRSPRAAAATAPRGARSTAPSARPAPPRSGDLTSAPKNEKTDALRRRTIIWGVGQDS